MLVKGATGQMSWFVAWLDNLKQNQIKKNQYLNAMYFLIYCYIEYEYSAAYRWNSYWLYTTLYRANWVDTDDLASDQ